MLRKTLLALLLLTLSTGVSAGIIDPNPSPGADNPGSRKDLYPFVVFAEVPVGRSSSQCGEVSDWCERQFADATVDGEAQAREACDGEEWCEAGARAFFEAIAIAELHCEASAIAQTRVRAFVTGTGALELTRHGNNGSMHHIFFGGGIDSTTAMIAEVDVGVGAGGSATAFVAAEGESFQTFCDSDTNDLAVRWNFCLRARAASEAEVVAQAVAESFAGADAMAGMGHTGGASAYNEVWGANLTQYRANLTASSGGFVAMNAGASAEVYADAYADAFAEAFAEACAKTTSNREVEVFNQEFCSAGRAEAEAEALARAQTWAEANTGGLAQTGLQFQMEAFYRNEPGTYENDIVEVSFNDRGGAIGFIDSFCLVPEGPPVDNVAEVPSDEGLDPNG
jgi:hypothetical protein